MSNDNLSSSTKDHEYKSANQKRTASCQIGGDPCQYFGRGFCFICRKTKQGFSRHLVNQRFAGTFGWLGLHKYGSSKVWTCRQTATLLRSSRPRLGEIQCHAGR